MNDYQDAVEYPYRPCSEPHSVDNPKNAAENTYDTYDAYLSHKK